MGEKRCLGRGLEAKRDIGGLILFKFQRLPGCLVFSLRLESMQWSNVLFRLSYFWPCPENRWL